MKTLLLAVAVSASLAATPAEETAAVEGLVSRVAPGVKNDFILHLIESSNCTATTGKCFGYSAEGGKVALKGTSGVELAMAFNHYLKYETRSIVSWWRTGGSQTVNLNATAPLPANTVHIERHHAEHYYANVCTFSYSFVWYQLKDWVAEIDWMALNGVTLPLAYTGQEKVYQKVYNKMGVTDEDLAGFFGGPAFLAWARGQGEMAWGGPLPQSWIDGQWEMQRQILPLMRAFGMRPVLPGFQGNVPLAFLKLYPTANISRVGTCTSEIRAAHACAPWMDALDPLFNTTADLFMKTLIDDFGTDHYYAADGTFSHTAAPWYDSARHEYDASLDAVIDEHAKQHSTAAFNGMARSDPDAVWIFQTWSWEYGAKQPYMQGWIEGAPKGRLVLLDLMAEESPIWKETSSYYGAPYIWCMLHNFGGNDGMWGDLPALSTGPTTSVNGTTIIGTGLTMEGTNQNPVVYEFMNEMAYRSEPVDLENWVAEYAARRYGTENADATAAWKVLLTTAYNASGYGMMESKDTVTAIPFGAAWDKLNGAHWYDEVHFLNAWSSLLKAGTDPKIKALEAAGVWTYRHDLADVTRQALAKFSSTLWTRLNASIVAKNACGVTMGGGAMETLANDTNTMVATVPGFSMGRWVEAAKTWGAGDENTTAQMSWNAKTQVTFWEYPMPSPTNSSIMTTPGLLDYANKQWSGLLDTYYGARWALYTKMEVQALMAGSTLDENTFHAALITWFNTWRDTHDSFPTEPIGDTYTVAQTMYDDYAPQIMEALQNNDFSYPSCE